jgi:hypothetical protein
MLQIEVLGKYVPVINLVTNGGLAGGAGFTFPSGWNGISVGASWNCDGDQFTWIVTGPGQSPRIWNIVPIVLPAGDYVIKFDVVSIDPGVTVSADFDNNGSYAISGITTPGTKTIPVNGYEPAHFDTGQIQLFALSSGGPYPANVVFDNIRLEPVDLSPKRGFLKLNPDARAAFVIDNYAVNRDSENPGEYSLPLEIPRGGINDVLLSFYHQIPQNERSHQFNANVYYKGILVYRGVLEISGSNHETYSTFLKILSAGLTGLDVNLRDIDYGPPIELGTNIDDRFTAIKVILDKNYPDTNINFPSVYNPKFYDEKNPNYTNFINLFDNATGTLARPYADPAQIEAVNKSAIVPFVHLMHILKSGFAIDDIRAEGELFDDHDLMQILIPNNVALENSPEKYRAVTQWSGPPIAGASPNDIDHELQLLIPLDTETVDDAGTFNTTTHEYTIAQAGWHSAVGEVNFEVINDVNPGSPDFVQIEVHAYKNGVYESTSPLYTGYNAPGPFTKKYSVRFYADVADIGAQFTLVLEWKGIPHVSTAPNFTYSLIFNSATATFINDTYGTLNQLPDQINIEQHVPDITFGELVNRFVLAYNIDLKYDLLQRKILFDFATTSLGLNPVDVTDKADPKYELVTAKLLFKAFNYDSDSTDELFESKTDQSFEDPNIIATVVKFEDLPTDASVTSGKLGYVRNQVRFFKAEIDQTTGVVTWNFHSFALPDVIHDKFGEIETRPECAPLFMGNAPDPLIPGNEMLVPVIHQVGESALFGLGPSPFGLRQVMWRGWQVQSDGSSVYPGASSGMYSFLGAQIADRTLIWEDTAGIFELNWEAWVTALHRAEGVTLTLNYNILDLITFNINRKIRFNNRTLIVKNLQYELGEFIEPAKAECVLLKG